MFLKSKIFDKIKNKKEKKSWVAKLKKKKKTDWKIRLKIAGKIDILNNFLSWFAEYSKYRLFRNFQKYV